MLTSTLFTWLVLSGQTSIPPKATPKKTVIIVGSTSESKLLPKSKVADVDSLSWEKRGSLIYVCEGVRVIIGESALGQIAATRNLLDFLATKTFPYKGEQKETSKQLAESLAMICAKAPYNLNITPQDFLSGAVRFDVGSVVTGHATVGGVTKRLALHQALASGPFETSSPSDRVEVKSEPISTESRLHVALVNFTDQLESLRAVALASSILEEAAESLASTLEVRLASVARLAIDTDDRFFARWRADQEASIASLSPAIQAAISSGFSESDVGNGSYKPIRAMMYLYVTVPTANGGKGGTFAFPLEYGIRGKKD